MIVVNFATGHYIRGQNRLRSSLNGYNFLGFTDYAQIGSPSHSESPYQFKIHAIEKALEQDDIILWADASLWRVGDLSKIENIIKTDGYFCEEAGHYCDRWLNAHAREWFKFQPHEHNFLMFSAGLLGLNKQSEIAMLFFKQWKESALAGCFRGSWEDHRHDMVCASVVAQRLGMKYQRGGSHLSYIGPGYSTPEPGSVFHLQGIQ